MKRLSLFLAFVLSCFCAMAQDASQFAPKASPEAEVVFGNARFTVLTSRLIRMEWAADAAFEDRATLGVVNRNLPVPQFSVKKSGSKVGSRHRILL